MGRKIVLLIFSFFLFFSCGKSISKGLVDDMYELEVQSAVSSEQSLKSIEEVRRFIKDEQDKALSLVNSSSDKGRFYRMIGLQYMHLEMYGEAYKAFAEARIISPKNPLLAYYQGLASANLASLLAKGSQEWEKYAQITISSYEIALNLKPDYKDPLMAISIFYAYEMGDLYKSLEYIDKYISLDSKNVKAWILKGNIYAALGEREQSLFSYSEALKNTNSSQEKQEIEALMAQVSR